MKILLKAKADPNAIDIARRTPLHLAVMKENLEATKLLLAHMSNPRA